MTAKKSKPAAANSDYVPSERELAVVRKAASRDDDASLAPSIKLENNQLTFRHPEPAFGHLLLQEALGSADHDFTAGLLYQLANALPKDLGPAEEQINFMISVVKSIKPRDQVEAMLAAQMAVIHAAVMTLGRRLMTVDNIPQQDSAERALNKLARTFAAQLEALKRYRGSGEQQVPVPAQSSSGAGKAATPGPLAEVPSDSEANLSVVRDPQKSAADESNADESPPRIVPMKRASGGR